MSHYRSVCPRICLKTSFISIDPPICDLAFCIWILNGTAPHCIFISNTINIIVLSAQILVRLRTLSTSQEQMNATYRCDTLDWYNLTLFCDSKKRQKHNKLSYWHHHNKSYLKVDCCNKDHFQDELHSLLFHTDCILVWL